ncbi:MAG: FkbM family methyltransferase [Myxococcaceae bacterium]|nr:FkbM family methyltransferase [Myxococcaceae bacterium]
MVREAVVEVLRPFYFRGKGRLMRNLLRLDGERTADVFGYRMRLDVSEYIQQQVYLGTFEPRETQWVRRWLAPGMSFVDVGANVGYFTLLASSLVGPTGRVFACEPSTQAFQRLEATLRENRVTQARAFPFALGSEPGELHLYFTTGVSQNHTPSMIPQPDGRPFPVTVRTLDDCLDEWGLEQVDLVKLDVEGFEPRILQGATKALFTGRIRALMCEFNDVWLRRVGSSNAALYALLRAHGFRELEHRSAPQPGTVENRFLVRA